MGPVRSGVRDCSGVVGPAPAPARLLDWDSRHWPEPPRGSAPLPASSRGAPHRRFRQRWVSLLRWALRSAPTSRTGQHPVVATPVAGSGRRCWQRGSRIRGAASPVAIGSAGGGADGSLYARGSTTGAVCCCRQLRQRLRLERSQTVLVVAHAVGARSDSRGCRRRWSGGRLRPADHEHDQQHECGETGQQPRLHATRQHTAR